VHTDEALAELFLATSRRIRRETMRRIRPLGLNPHLSRALRVIGDHARLRPSQLAALLDVAPRSASDTISALVAAGWVARSLDPADGRAYRVELTAAGQALAREVRAIRTAVTAEVFGVLDDAERQVLSDFLCRLGV
jgi:DNA-binding MarR family transcriptional regulator